MVGWGPTGSRVCRWMVEPRGLCPAGEGGGHTDHQPSSQLVVKLVLVAQVDPAEDERGQSEGQHHDEHGGAGVARLLGGACGGGEGEGRPARWLGLLALLLRCTPLPGAQRATARGCLSALVGVHLQRV